MAIIDSLRWEGTPDIFAWKYPESNLTTFTQLVVNESQEAVLFHKGALLAIFGPGKHTLSTENIPLLENLFGIPFGGKNPFTAEVWFVNKVFSMDIKWGTPQPFQIRDPQYSVVMPLRVNGQFGIHISDSRTFLVKLVGTLPSFDETSIRNYFRGFILSKSTAIIAGKLSEEKICILDIASHIFVLSEALKEGLKGDFELYGIELVNFFINQISIPDNDSSVVRLKELLSKRAEMDILGYSYNQERSFDVLGDAARNEGTMGDLMGIGMGFGMGAGLRTPMADLIRGSMENAVQPFKTCPNCHAKAIENAQYCSTCGYLFASSTALSGTIVCDKCKKEIPPNIKYCPHCGDIYNPCPKCNCDVPENSKQCPKCGTAMPVRCPRCSALTPFLAKFCSSCGEALQKKCTQCGSDLMVDMAFCSICGNKV